MIEPLYFTNQGPDIESTNFWTSAIAREGKFYMTTHAGAVRILLPDSLEKWLPEMYSAKEVIVSRGLLLGNIPALEILFGDGSPRPFTMQTAAGACALLPRRGEQFTTSIWTKGPGESAVCRLRLPGRYRHVRQLPCRKAWEVGDELKRYY